MQSAIQSSSWTHPADDPTYELLWVRVGSDVFVGALYHPPKPIYRQLDLLNYIEVCVECLSRDHPSANIIIAGDLNQLSDEEMVERTGLTQIVQQPTRGVNILDRVFVSNPLLFGTVRVVTSTVRSDHKAVVAFTDSTNSAQAKKTFQRTFRRKSPAQHAMFLKCAATMSPHHPRQSDSSEQNMNTQAEFDHFYATALGLLNKFHPERTITITTRDPDYITPEIKSKLRRRNRLMRAERVEEAGALARHIGYDIKRHGKTRLNHIDVKTTSKDLWQTVRRVTGRQQEAPTVDGVTAESLHNHYFAISNDPTHTPPLLKQTTSTTETQYISEWSVFQILDYLHPTATGLDGIPAWFLRLGAPVFCQQIAHLFNLSLHFYRSSSVEEGQHPANTQSVSSHAACRLQTYFNHTSPHPSHGANSCSSFP